MWESEASDLTPPNRQHVPHGNLPCVVIGDVSVSLFLMEHSLEQTHGGTVQPRNSKLSISHVCGP